jgi:hypothetical protein
LPEPFGELSHVIAELQAMAEDSLGNRAGKIKQIIADAESTPAGLGVAIDQIASTSLVLVDQSRMKELAARMRVALNRRGDR